MLEELLLAATLGALKIRYTVQLCTLLTESEVLPFDGQHLPGAMKRADFVALVVGLVFKEILCALRDLALELGDVT